MEIRINIQSAIAGLAAGMLLAGGVAWASGPTDATGEQVCRTKAGYLRISSTGECRRSEVPVELPAGAQGEQGIQGEQGETGPQGIQGEQGSPGKDGISADADVLNQTVAGLQTLTARLDEVEQSLSSVTGIPSGWGILMRGHMDCPTGFSKAFMDSRSNIGYLQISEGYYMIDYTLCARN